MKLLFLTQVLDSGDAVLGFTTRWIYGLAKRCERVRVIALEVGDTGGLPPNVDWREVGRKGRVGRYLRYQRYLKEAFGEGFDTVLGHMVPRYSLLARGPARRAGARTFLWYTHATVDGRLRRAVDCVEKVFTASDESLRVDTPKKVVTGHGIDLHHFKPPEGDTRAVPPRILAVGRLTPRKDPLTVLAAVSILVSRGYDLALDLVGAGMTTADEGYARTVREQIELGGLEGRVELLGAVPYRDIPTYYHRATCLVNSSFTGSLDKVVLEALAAGCPFVSCSDAAPGVVSALGGEAQRFLFEPRNADQLADRLEAWLKLREAERRQWADRMRQLVAADHEVDALMARLVDEMGSPRAVH